MNAKNQMAAGLLALAFTLTDANPLRRRRLRLPQHPLRLNLLPKLRLHQSQRPVPTKGGRRRRSSREAK